MKTILILLTAFVTSFTSLFSQDIITLKNNYTIEAKNIVVTPTDVKYQNFYADSGEVLVLQKSKVISILYQNGSKVKIYEPAIVVTQTSVGENLITFHFLDFAISNFTVSYEKIITNGKYGIQIPLSFGYSNKPRTIYFPPPFEDGYTNNLTNQFYTGITFNIYPSGQGKFKYFLGPSLRFGYGKYYENWTDYNSHTNAPIHTGYVKFLVNNGIVFTFANSLSITAIGSIGIQHMYKVNTSPTQTTGALSLNMSFRF